MVQIIEPNESIAGRIGKGFGQGLADQLPKEIERSRLSHGLKQLGKKDLSGKNQLELLGDIYNIPGIAERPELAALAQQQIAKQNYQNRQDVRRPPNATGAQPSKEELVGNAQPNAQQQPKQIRSLSEDGIATPEQIKESRRNRIQEPSYDEVFDKANQILNQGLTQDPAQAEAMAKSNIQQDRQAQKDRIATFRNEASDRIKLDLQGTGLGDYKDVPGEIQQRLLDQGEYLISQGVSPEDASQQVQDIARELGKVTNNTRDTGSWSNMFRSAKSKGQELRSQKKEFEKYGFGEFFDDIATGALGITPMQAAHELDPIKNKALNDEIGKLRKQPGPTLRKVTGNIGREMNAKTLDSLVRKITPQDNLFAIEYDLREKGYDVNQFKRRVDELESAKELHLSPQQKRQQRRDIGNQFFGDILYQSF